MSAFLVACMHRVAFVGAIHESPVKKNLPPQKYIRTIQDLNNCIQSPHGRGSCLVACDVTEGVDPRG